VTWNNSEAHCLACLSGLVSMLIITSEVLR
jgi:hypothetical protein